MLTTLLPIVLLQALSASAAPLLSSRDASASLIDCLSTANLNPISASSSSYSQDISAYNQRIQPKPAAVVYPSTPSLVSASITCASSAGVSVSARSGGHSYASYGQGGTDGALVIDLGAFKHISVDQGTGVATIGGGVRLGDIALGLNELGRGLPHGTCPYVGVGGHASFGGFGLAGRRNGLLVDTVVALDVVLANGTIISKLTNEIDPDLFWALRGSAQSYGIITTFYFQSFEAPAKATNFAYSYYGMSAGDAAGLFSLWQKFGAESAPADLGTSFTIGTGGSIDISGVYYGTADEFHDVFDPFVDTIPTGYQQKVDELSWIDSLAALAGGQALNTSGAADSRDDFLAKSLMTPEASLITDEALESYFKYLFTTTTSTAWFVEVNLYGGKNSVINSHDLAFNSFGHRSSLLTFQMYASSPSYSPPYPDEGFSFLEGMYDALVQPMASAWGSSYGAYVNYIDPTLTAEETRDLYWASQYDRLSSLKAVYDPLNTLSNPQSIVGTTSSNLTQNSANSTSSATALGSGKGSSGSTSVIFPIPTGKSSKSSAESIHVGWGAGAAFLLAWLTMAL